MATVPHHLGTGRDSGSEATLCWELSLEVDSCPRGLPVKQIIVVVLDGSVM